MLKLAEMEYNGANSIFLRLLLDKKYALPFRVLDALVAHFLSFRSEKRMLPVLWHQSLLTLAQRYKADLASEQKTSLLELLKIQTHPQISAEIRRELQNSESRDIEIGLPVTVEMDWSFSVWSNTSSFSDTNDSLFLHHEENIVKSNFFICPALLKDSFKTWLCLCRQILSPVWMSLHIRRCTSVLMLGDFVSCISELLSCSFGAVITWNTKTGICVHLIKSNFVVLKQQFGLKANWILKNVVKHQVLSPFYAHIC